MDNITLEKLLENLFDAVYYVDLERKIIFWNKAAERITGYKKDEVIGHKCSENILRHIDENGNELCLKGCPLLDSITCGKNIEIDAFLHHKNGHRIPIIIRASPVYDNDNNITGAIEIFSDNSKILMMKDNIENLRKDLYIDQLTQVSNRRYCDMQIQSKLYELDKFGNNFGIIFIDIDNFKNFNDKYGHNTGDDVLKLIGKTISNQIRKFDIICRYGGEEFIVICSDINENIIIQLSERIRIFVERSFLVINNETIFVTISSGATIAKNGDKLNSIINRADKLMYESKKGGKNKVTIG
jgi:diguanylate cyclase (GGDEF)-like protein/PAS domain S-box-containing protein